MPAPPTGIRSVHLCALLLLLTLAPPFLTTNANEQFFFSTLTISSPRHGSAVASPVTPIIIALIPSEPYPSLSAAPLPPNQIELSFDSLSPFSPSSLLSSELLPSLGLTLCFHISGERGFSCADAPLETNPATLGSLFQLQPGEHTVIAFLVDDSVDDSAKVTDKKFPTECSYSTLAAHACPLSLLPPATVTYTTSTFTQLPQEVSKIPYVTSDSTTPLLSKQARTEYFDEVYSAEIWSFPDLDGSVAVKSGFGSTLHQTAQIRPFLDMYFKYNDVRRILDVPCGDMHWMPHVPHLSEGTTCYFGGDVSERVVGENRERFRGNGNFRFDTVDLVGENIMSYQSVRETIECSQAGGVGGGLVVHARHLMFHLSPDDNLKLLKNLFAMALEVAPSMDVTVMLSTHLLQNENSKSYQLASGHKINLFQYPYCLPTPDHLVHDGDSDLYMALYDYKALNKTRVDHSDRSCL